MLAFDDCISTKTSLNELTQLSSINSPITVSIMPYFNTKNCLMSLQHSMRLICTPQLNNQLTSFACHINV